MLTLGAECIVFFNCRNYAKLFKPHTQLMIKLLIPQERNYGVGIMLQILIHICY